MHRVWTYTPTCLVSLQVPNSKSLLHDEASKSSLYLEWHCIKKINKVSKSMFKTTL